MQDQPVVKTSFSLSTSSRFILIKVSTWVRVVGTLHWTPIAELPILLAVWLIHCSLGLETVHFTSLWNDSCQSTSLFDWPREALHHLRAFSSSVGKYNYGVFLFMWESLHFRGEVNISIVFGNKDDNYSHLYSAVLAADIYAMVSKNDPLNPRSGEKYRESILACGGSHDELDSIVVCCGAMLHSWNLPHHWN